VKVRIVMMPEDGAPAGSNLAAVIAVPWRTLPGTPDTAAIRQAERQAERR
jgi:hypothetical protein